jgi:hypothetical protein
MKKMLVALLVLNFSSLAGAELAGEYIAEGRLWSVLFLIEVTL